MCEPSVLHALLMRHAAGHLNKQTLLLLNSVQLYIWLTLFPLPWSLLPCRGALFTALIVLYALTACIAGYVSTSYYVQMEGTAWVQNILTTCFCYCGPFFAMFMFLNTVAIVYRVSVCVACSVVLVLVLVHTVNRDPAGRQSVSDVIAPLSAVGCHHVVSCNLLCCSEIVVV